MTARSSVHIIAEAGTNHNGDYKTAKKLVDVAVVSGADSVKFQLIYPEGLYLPKIYENNSYTDNPVFKIRSSGMLSDREYGFLAGYARTRKIKFSASVFDERGIGLLKKNRAAYIKIASCDLNHIDLISMAAETGKKVVLSTGMASLGEIEKTINRLFSTGSPDVTLMHCVSIYPCPTRLMNLGFIRTLQSAFGLPVGLSDHTENSLAGAIGVSMGVDWIEKHFTLNRKTQGFDHAYAMEPTGFKNYVEDIREAEQACRRPGKKLSGGETKTKLKARRGLYAARDLNPGDKIAPADVLVVRPESAMAPEEKMLITGKKVRTAVKKYQTLQKSLFE